MPVGTAVISPEEARRAIYVDYECSQERPPTLLGVLVESQLTQSIVEKLFETCAGRWRVRDVTAREHKTFVRELVGRAVTEDRVIISWSEFDYHHLLSSDPELEPYLHNKFRNAIPTARKWRRKAHPNVKGENSLLSYLSLTNFAVPDRFEGQVVGTALRLIRSQLIQGRTYEALTPAAKQGWRTVVRHNQYDLWGMCHVMQTMAGQG